MLPHRRFPAVVPFCEKKNPGVPTATRANSRTAGSARFTSPAGMDAGLVATWLAEAGLLSFCANAFDGDATTTRHKTAAPIMVHVRAPVRVPWPRSSPIDFALGEDTSVPAFPCFRRGLSCAQSLFILTLVLVVHPRLQLLLELANCFAGGILRWRVSAAGRGRLGSLQLICLAGQHASK